MLVVTMGKKSYSQLNLSSLKNVDSTLYHFVTEWSGVKYVFGGITKAGVDCSGFTYNLYEKVYNFILPRRAKDQYKKAKKVQKDSLILGDLVFFRTSSRTGWHVGVYLMDGYFIHSANRKSGVKINSIFEPYYSRTYLSGGRI